MAYYLLTISLLSAVGPVQITTIDGSIVQGELSALTTAQAMIETDHRSRAIPVDKISSIRPTQAPADSPAAGILVELAGGSNIRAVEFLLANDVATLSLSENQQLQLSTGQINTVRLRQPSELYDAQWKEITAETYESDVLIFRKTEQTLSYLEGVVAEVTADKVVFQFADETIEPSREKIEGIKYFAKPNDRAASARLIATTINGGTWKAQSAKLADNQLQIVTNNGDEVLLPWKIVTSVDLSAARTLYLSSLEPLDRHVTPYFPSTFIGDLNLKLNYAPVRDRGRKGDSLSVLTLNGDRQQYERGLAIHSRTELVYRLPDAFRRLQAIAGIDPGWRPGGHVRLVIDADDKTLLDTEIDGNDPPLPIDLDITGARRIRILVGYGHGLDVADNLNLCNLRVTQ